MQLARTVFKTLILILFLTILNVFNTKQIVRSPNLMLVVWTEYASSQILVYLGIFQKSTKVLSWISDSCIIPVSFQESLLLLFLSNTKFYGCDTSRSMLLCIISTQQ